MGELLTVKEFGEVVKRKPKTIYRWIREGNMFQPNTVTRVRDGYLIKASEGERLLQEGIVL